MTRVVYVGGFGNGISSAERVGEALAGFYDEVDVFTFSQYARSSRDVYQAMRGVDLVTHSAGALSLGTVRARPESALLLNAPLPGSIGRLLAKTVVKTVRMHTPGVGIHKPGDVGAVARYSASSVAELATHPVANLSNLRRISQFDAVGAAIAAEADHVPTRLVWTTGDAYFSPTEEDGHRAASGNVPLMVLPGEHDEVVLRPGQFLDHVLNGHASGCSNTAA